MPPGQQAVGTWVLKTMILFLTIFLTFCAFCHGECGFSSCPQIEPDFLNVHIVPHSHNDVGWLKTVDQYYYGANNSIQNAGVQYIYDSVVDELWKDRSKKFVSVEMEFFHHWWKEQDIKMRFKVKQIVERGQLEFVGGGWCMNDEASASYVDIIDQMTLGLKFLNLTFGECGIPSSVWQVDPFGHSKEQASLFSQMGFLSLFFGRIDYQDKKHRLEQKQMEMIWKASDDLSTDIFTGILFNSYSPPSGFCFDILCGDETIVDDPDSPAFNINRRAKELIAYIKDQSRHYSSNNIILTMGEDFHYQYAHAWFKNLDKLIRFINKMYKQDKIRLFYSTPSCYGKAVRDSGIQLPVNKDDFFPYASDPHAYWTGYFTSRSSFKDLVRQSSNILQACKHLEVSRFPGGWPSRDLYALMRSQAIGQHHDAITGTAKQHVSNDYVLRLSDGVQKCQTVMSQAYSQLLQLDSTPVPEQRFCPLLNISECTVTEKSRSFVVTAYNPLAWNVSSIIRFPVEAQNYVVIDSDGQMVQTQYIPIPMSIQNIPGRRSQARNELVFWAINLPPLGGKSFHVTVQKDPSKETLLERSTTSTFSLPQPKDIKVVVKERILTFSGQTGQLIHIMDDKQKASIKQEFLMYKGMEGNNTKFEFRASGAYIFRPNGTAIPLGQILRIYVTRGPIVTEIFQEITDWVSHVYRIYDGESFVESDWVVGPISVRDGIGKEIISRFTAEDIQNEGTFYTDSNSRATLKRVVNQRSTYSLNVTEPVAGNYYPVSSFIYIRDEKTRQQVTVLVDRAEGGASLQDGQLELMVHRRLLHDDAFGVGEPLNETAYDQGLVVRGSHWLLVSSSKNAIWRPLAQRRAHPPLISFVPTEWNFQQWKAAYNMQFSLVTRTLPKNVHLLTLEPWGNGNILIRLEHIYQKGEDEQYSLPVTFSIKDWFTTFTIKGMEEWNLSVNKEITRNDHMTNWEVTLQPMEIRTFLLRV